MGNLWQGNCQMQRPSIILLQVNHFKTETTGLKCRTHAASASASVAGWQIDFDPLAV
jgi:hypothetical protein